MNDEHETSQELRSRIAAAQVEGGVDLKLITDIVAYAEARNAAGASLDDVADELGVPAMATGRLDRTGQQARNERGEPISGMLKVMAEVPFGSLLADDRVMTDLADLAADWLKRWAEKLARGR